MSTQSSVRWTVISVQNDLHYPNSFVKSVIICSTMTEYKLYTLIVFYRVILQ